MTRRTLLALPLAQPIAATAPPPLSSEAYRQLRQLKGKVHFTHTAAELKVDRIAERNNS